MKYFEQVEDAKVLALAIVDTIPEPFLVLDHDLRVIAASRAFYRAFDVNPEHTRGRLLYALGDGQWDIPALRLLLETIIPERTAMDGFEVEHDFPGIGRRVMLLNARMVFYEQSATSTILLAIRDITVRREIEREKAALLKHAEQLLADKQVLLQEMQHRVANSLQIIASILVLKARAITSDETRHHLLDAHRRVMSVAEVQMHLHASDGVDEIDAQSYFAKLCSSLAASMIGEAQPISIVVEAEEGTMESGKAVSVGLMVTELVINAIKYAFPGNRPGLVRVSYSNDGSHWAIIVADDGIGTDPGQLAPKGGGLGTNIVNALARQLHAEIRTTGGAQGTTVTVTGSSARPTGKARLAAVRQSIAEAGEHGLPSDIVTNLAG